MHVIPASLSQQPGYFQQDRSKRTTRVNKIHNQALKMRKILRNTSDLFLQYGVFLLVIAINTPVFQSSAVH
jgi:hypothetical protein